jgi:hypothetical protein
MTRKFVVIPVPAPPARILKPLPTEEVEVEVEEEEVEAETRRWLTEREVDDPEDDDPELDTPPVQEELDWPAILEDDTRPFVAWAKRRGRANQIVEIAPEACAMNPSHPDATIRFRGTPLCDGCVNNRIR